MSGSIAAVEPNLIDRLVTIVDPERGMARQRARHMLALSGSYVGARYDRRQMNAWWGTRGSADADSLTDIPTLRSRSRDLVRNAPLAGGAINTVVLNVVGTGLALQPTPDRAILGWEEDQATTWAHDVAHEFALWADSQDCDVTRTTNFYESQELVFRSVLESGDCFTLIPMVSNQGSIYSTRFQIIEADRVANPSGLSDGQATKAADGSASPNRVYAGIEKDANGAPVAYHILREHPGSVGFMANRTETDRYVAFGAKTGRRNVLHQFRRLRPDQTRGVPYLAPVIESLKQLDKYTEAEIMAAVVTSLFTVFIKSGTGDVGLGSGMAPAPPVKPGELALQTGAIIGLAPGEEPVFPASPRPNSGFDPFVTSILRQIGVCLELPFEVLVKHFTSSYTAARASFLEAWRMYRNRRTFLASRFCQPLFETWMDEAVVLGRVKAPGYFADVRLRRAYLSADWVGDAPGAIDEVKEVTGAKERVNMGVSTLQEETMKMSGRNWSDLHPQRAKEHALRAAAGLEPGILNATATEMVPDDGQDGDDDDTKPKPAAPGQDAPENAPSPTPAKSKPAPAKKSGGGR